MPYQPTVDRNFQAKMIMALGHEFRANMARQGQSLSNTLNKVFEDRKREGQEADKLRSLLSHVDKDNADLYKTMGLANLRGTAEGMALKSAMAKESQARAYNDALTKQLTTAIEQQQQERTRQQGISQDIAAYMGSKPVQAQGPYMPGQSPPMAMSQPRDLTAQALTEILAKRGAATPEAVAPLLRQGSSEQFQRMISGSGGAGPMQLGSVTADSTGRLTATMLPKQQTTIPENMVPTSVNVDAAGRPTTSYGPPPSPTMEQSNAMQFSERMRANNGIISSVESSGFNAASVGAGVQEWMPNLIRSENMQQYEAARENWIAAVLRKESGAAISKAEYADARKQYFPVMGDSPAVVKQKEALRLMAEENMRRGAGQFAPKTSPAATNQPALLLRSDTGVPPQVKVFTDASGARWLYTGTNSVPQSDTNLNNWKPAP